MRRKSGPRLAPVETHGARLAWWAAFAATIALVAILNLVRSAEAATLPVPSLAAPSLLAFEDEEVEDEEEELAEECREVAEDELECFEVEVDEAAVPDSCRLTSTDAWVSISPHGKLRLSVRYRAATPAMVAVDSSLRGAKGKLNLDGDRRRFAGSGTFLQTQLLGSAETAKAMAARSFMVEIRPLGAPNYCHTYFDQRLSAEHPGGRGPLRLS
jgi:hypothetical protein